MAFALVLLLSLTWVGSQVLPSLLQEELPYVAARHVTHDATLLDPGQSGRSPASARPWVQLPDGHVVRLEESMPTADLPPVGQRMPVSCVETPLGRIPGVTCSVRLRRWRWSSRGPAGPSSDRPEPPSRNLQMAGWGAWAGS
ncbi:hypothetical protein GCM10008955_16610 [Deinococcus malanensis]|uniref:Uncharacterized protein n=1 Tax=Deinococcus malanensis TaxID=1706855 RepID=A0ABQ2EW27_9DEIO|nr:hypothetical protein GCM10008955_16610 [Deinococcus malanensis]